MILEDFSSLRPGTVFYMVIFMGEKCVLARSENRVSGPTAFQMSIRTHCFSNQMNEKSSKIIENIRFRISKDHNS